MSAPAVRTAEPPREVEVTAELARRLVAEQHPAYAHLQIVHAEDGWDNVMFRLGDDLALRMPRRLAGAALIVTEQTWLAQLAPRLPLPVPAPIAVGEPGHGYPWRWSIVPWLEGEPSDLAPPDASQGEVLAGFLAALHQPAPADAPHNAYRGSITVGERRATFEQRLAEAVAMHGVVSPALRHWFEAGAAVPVDAPRTWFHGDLHGRNVLVKNGRFSAVIDWGDMAAGDPACDLAAIWLLLPDLAARREAVASYAASEATWARARGWAALMISMLISITNNPRMPAMALRMMGWLEAGP